MLNSVFQDKIQCEVISIILPLGGSFKIWAVCEGAQDFQWWTCCLLRMAVPCSRRTEGSQSDCRGLDGVAGKFIVEVRKM